MSSDEDLLGIAWADPAYFELGGTLDFPADALTYFGASRFYDRQSNNEVVAMQTRNASRIDLDKISLT
jgi:hypothetical protein